MKRRTVWASHETWERLKTMAWRKRISAGEAFRRMVDAAWNSPEWKAASEAGEQDHG